MAKLGSIVRSPRSAKVVTNFAVIYADGSSTPAADQRGIARTLVDGGVDRGAFEGTAPSLLALANFSNDVYATTDLGYVGPQGYPNFYYLAQNA